MSNRSPGALPAPPAGPARRAAGRFLALSLALSLLPASVLPALLVGCSPAPPARFTPAAWRRAGPEARYPLAEAFLRGRDVTRLSVKELEALLGRPDGETDLWEYHLSGRGAPPDRPRLCVWFRDGRVREVSPGYGLELRRGAAFGARRWAAAPPEGRRKMAGDLVERGLLLGRDKAAVRRALGEPDAAMPERALTYGLGTHGIGLDGVWLEFTVDGEGRVTSGRVVHG